MRTALLMLGALSTFAPAAEVPRQIEVTYDVSWNGMSVGKGVDKFEHDGRRYRIVSDTKTTGLAAMLRKMSIHIESNGLISKGLLQPLSYMEERTRKPRRSAQFDWTRKQITLDSGGGPKVVPLPDHAVLDRASFPWSFAFSAPEREGRITFTDGRKLSEYRYAVAGKVRISTPAGTLETLHVKKIQEAGDERGFEMWLALDKHHLPARVLFRDDDDTVDSVVSAIVIPTKP